MSAKKSIKYVIIALAIIIVVVAASLAMLYWRPAAPTVTSPTTATGTAVIYSYKVPTGSITGTFYIAAQAIFGVVSKYDPQVILVAIPGGGSVSNSRAVGKGDVPISLSTSLVAYYAYRGLAPIFPNESYPKLRAVAPIHSLYVGFFVSDKSPMNTVYDLAGKRVAIGEPGSGDAVCAEIILREAGIWDKVIKLNVGDPESWDLLRTGQVDAVIHHTILPNPSLYDISVKYPIKFVNIPDELADRIISKYPIFKKAIAPKNVYVGAVEAKILAVPSLIIANADAPEDLIYRVVKGYWEHFDEIVKGAAFLKEVDRKDPFAGIGIPLHKGAYKYWVEKGYTVPSHLIPPELKS